MTISVINLQVMKHCRYEKSLVLSHTIDLCDYYNFDYNTSIQEDNN